MDVPFDSYDRAIKISDPLSIYVTLVKGLDVFWKNPPIFSKYFFIGLGKAASCYGYSVASSALM
jgi:hypothetical protein